MKSYNLIAHELGFLTLLYPNEITIEHAIKEVRLLERRAGKKQVQDIINYLQEELRYGKSKILLEDIRIIAMIKSLYKD